MRELSLHILDIAENAISAGASKVHILVEENLGADQLRLRVEDNGKGMSPEMVEAIQDPFVTSRQTRKVGLGIPMLKQAAKACNGNLEIDSQKGSGTTLEAVFQHCHIDRMPLGNLADTFIALEMGSPEVNWVFEYINDDHKFYLDDLQIKDALDGVCINEPSISAIVRGMITDGIAAVNQATVSQGELNA